MKFSISSRNITSSAGNRGGKFTLINTASIFTLSGPITTLLIPTFTLSGPTIGVTVTMVAPPSISGDAIAGGTLFLDVGLDSPETTYTIQWVSGPTDYPTTPIIGATGILLTLGSLGGQYVTAIVTPGNGQPVRRAPCVRIHYATMTAPVLSRTSTSGATPFTYTVTYDNTVFADDIEHVQYASDLDFVNILWEASRGLTEAAFNPPYTSDESEDADPAWSTPKPVMTGTIFVRRWVSTLGSLVSFKSDPISNQPIDATVRLSPSSSWSNNDVPADKFLFSNNNLTFSGPPTAGPARAGTVNYFRAGNRTVDMVMEVMTSDGRLGFGFDDGSYIWGPGFEDYGPQFRLNRRAGWKGFYFYLNPDGYIGTYISYGETNGSGAFEPSGGSVGVTIPGDIMRIVYTQGTFAPGGQDAQGNPLPDVPNNDATAQTFRIRNGAIVGAANLITGLPSMKRAKVIFGGGQQNSVAGVGTFVFGNNVPAVGAGSKEYQDV